MSAELAELDILTRRWTIEEYFELGETGVIKPDERTELIRGEIVMIPPIGPWHSGTVNRTSRSIHQLIGEDAIISTQNPVLMGADSAPEPDFTILRNRDDFYSQSHPTPKDVILTIEISDSTYLYDKNVKAPLYAEHGIPEFWLIHKKRSELTVFSNLENGIYQSEKSYSGAEKVTIPELEIEITLSDFGI